MIEVDARRAGTDAFGVINALQSGDPPISVFEKQARSGQVIVLPEALRPGDAAQHRAAPSRHPGAALLTGATRASNSLVKGRRAECQYCLFQFRRAQPATGAIESTPAARLSSAQRYAILRACRGNGTVPRDRPQRDWPAAGEPVHPIIR